MNKKKSERDSPYADITFWDVVTVIVAPVLMVIVMVALFTLAFSVGGWVTEYQLQRIDANAVWYEQCILEQEGVSVERCRMNNNNQNCVCREK
jgi:membrane-associated protease RseP (regulator of RpoE activity)